MEPGEPDTPRAERPDSLTDVLASIRALVSAETAARIDENEAEREDVVMLTAEMRVAEPTRDGELLAEGLAGLRSAGRSAGKERIAATSKCAMKKSGSALRSTSTETSSSAAMRSASAASSPKSGSVIRLIGGLSMVATATRSALATRTSVRSS